MDNSFLYTFVSFHFILAVCLSLVFFAESTAQSTNDYRSVASGNWTSLSVWQTYNGTSWVAATTYPGEVAGTNDVSIEGGYSVTLSANVPNAFNSLTIGDGTGATDVLLIAAASNLLTYQVTIANGGFVSWTANVTLSIPAGAAFVIESGGSMDNSTPCSAAKRLVIGTVVFSACNGGGGASYSFNELNTGGGSLNVSPSSNTPICVGDVLNLFSNAEGLESTSATFSWSATGPGGYSFSSTLEDPTVSGLTAGTYTYTVTATSGSLSNTKSTEVLVNSAPNVPTSMGNETICDGDAIPTLSASVNSGETVDWYDAASGGTLLLSGNTSYTPSTAGSYYAEARNTTTGCVSNTRTAISITSNPCPSGPGKIIMNRHIKSRVNNN